MTTFTIPCPHCSHGNEDPFEVTTRGSVDWMNCHRCKRPFHYLNLECNHCAEENVFTWPQAPQEVHPELLCCSACGRSLGEQDVSTSTSCIGDS